MKVLGEPAECTGDVFSKPMGVHGIHGARDASRLVDSMHVSPGKSVDGTVDRQNCDLSIGWTGNDENVMGARDASRKVVSMHVWRRKSVDATVDQQIFDLSIGWKGNDENVMGTNIDNT
jgi:hypothetical protein